MDRNLLTRVILIFLIIFPFLYAFLYIYLFGVNVPYYDQFLQEVEGIIKYYNGSLSFDFLFSHFNENRPFFERVVSIVLGVITGYNVIYESVLTILITIVSLGVLFLMFKKDHGISNISLLFFVPVAYYVFNLLQLGNFLFGLYLGHALTVLMFFLAVYLIDETMKINWKFFIAILAAIVGSFSHVTGLVIWPVIFLQICLGDVKDRSKRLFVWGISAVALFIVYFTGYEQPGYHPPIFYAFQHYSSGVAGFLTSVGTAVFHDVVLHADLNLLMAPFFGIFMIALFFILIIVNWKSDVFRANSKWMSLVFFSLLLSAAITIGRSAFGELYVYQLKYYVVTYPSIIGIYCFSLNCIAGQKETALAGSGKSAEHHVAINHVLFGMIFLLLLTGIVSHNLQGIEYGIYYKQTRNEFAYILQNYNNQVDNRLVLLFPVYDSSEIPERASFLRNTAAFLEKHNMSVFATNGIDPGHLSALEEDRLFFWVDQINGEVTENEPVIINRSMDSEFIVEGWAIDARASAPAGGVYISVDDSIYPTLYSLQRDDIARYFNNSKLLNTGFRLRLSSEILTEGEHHLSVLILTHDRTGVFRPEKQFAISVV